MGREGQTVALGAAGREWRLMEGDAGVQEKGRGRSVPKNALVWTVGSSVLLLSIAVGPWMLKRMRP